VTLSDGRYDGKDPGSNRPGPLAGVLVTLLFDLIAWFFCVFAVADQVIGTVNAQFAVAMIFGFVAVGAILFWLARRHGHHEFANGVILATSVVVLLSGTCWGLIGVRMQ
jgi:hypothetical protein